MVDKVDRPDAKTTYRIESAAETKKDKPHDERQHDQEAHYQQKKRDQEWEKFQTDPGIRKTILVPVSEIAHLKYRRVSPRHASPTADADLIWKDGRITENVSFLLGNMEAFLKIKNLKIGESIPSEFWAKGKELEVTVGVARSGSGPWSLQEIEARVNRMEKEKPAKWQTYLANLGIWDLKTKSIRGAILVLYILFTVIIITVFVTILGL